MSEFNDLENPYLKEEENVQDLLNKIILDYNNFDYGGAISGTVSASAGTGGAIGSPYFYSTSNYPSMYSGSTVNYSVYGSGGAGANGPSGSNITFNSSNLSNVFQVSGDSEFNGDVKIKGVSIVETLSAIEKRLAILIPDPKKLEHFESLKKAYQHYKTLEALCELPLEDKEK